MVERRYEMTASRVTVLAIYRIVAALNGVRDRIVVNEPIVALRLGKLLSSDIQSPLAPSPRRSLTTCGASSRIVASGHALEVAPHSTGELVEERLGQTSTRSKRVPHVVERDPRIVGICHLRDEGWHCLPLSDSEEFEQLTRTLDRISVEPIGRTGWIDP